MAGTNSTGTTDAFAEVCEAIAGLMAQVVREEILTRYRIGVLLRTVRSGAERYGERPIERIAAKLGHPTADPHGHCIPALDGTMPPAHGISCRCGL